MKLWGIVRFELSYQLRRGTPWLILAVLLGLSFLLSRDRSAAEAMFEDFFVNAPFAIAKTTVLGGIVWLLVGAVIAGEAAARDVATGMHPLMYTTPVTRAEYLGGRFLAALVLNALLLLGVQAGIMLGVYAPGGDAAAIGPFRPAAYLTAYGFIALPNALATTAIQFWLASRSGRTMSGYGGSMVVIFMGIFVASLLLYGRPLGSLLDPTGMRFVLEDLAHEWTATERNARLLALEGSVLGNRLVWVGVALAVLATTYVRFRFGHRTQIGWWPRLRARRAVRGVAAPARATPSGAGDPGSAVLDPIPAVRTFGFPTQLRQTFAIAWGTFRTTATSRVGLALLIVIPVLSLPLLIADVAAAGVPRLPTTALIIAELTAPLTAPVSTTPNRWLIVPLLLVFFAGEVIWREREAGLGDITDAMPTSEWPPLLGKLLGLGLVLAVFLIVLAATGMVVQTMFGHRQYEIGLYLKALLGLQLPEYLLFAVLALAVHAVANQKYIGHLGAIIAYVIIVVPSLFGIEHTMLVYGAGPWWTYSDMRGFGTTLGPWAWFKLYWAAWALLLAVLARLLWPRGRDGDLQSRIRAARRRFAGPTALTAAGAVGLVVVLGGFVFYDTRVRDTSLTETQYTELLAEYERRYGRYEGIAQPRLAATRLHVDIHPTRGTVDFRGTYHLVNRSAVPIDSVHLATVPGAETRAVAFDRPAAAVVSDDARGHRIYDLGRPLQPGDSLRLQFEVHVPAVRNRGVDAAVVSNGTFFTSAYWLPAIGYQPKREITSASDRRAHRLPPRRLLGSVHDTAARMAPVERTTLDLVMGTDDGQVAVAPGALRRTWTEGGRRYFHYVTDGPVGTDYSFFSARYAVREARWSPPAGRRDPSLRSGRPVAVRIYHHPGHAANVDRMARSIEASLDFYTTSFGPYPFSHLTAVEVRGTEIGMRAEPGLIRFSEGTALWRPGDGPRNLDLPFAVMAHEMAHQWWGHQLEVAYVEGGGVLAEGVAEYSALALIEATHGRERLRRQLAFMRQPEPFAPIRRGEPLLRGLDPYLNYRKSPFALHALSERIGRERVLEALRRLLQKHPRGAVPLATTLDLYRELQAVTPDSLRYLLHDLYEVNAFWEFEAVRARAEQTDSGGWRVTLDVRARKAVADSAGAVSVVPLDEWVDVGIFAAAAAGDARLSAPLYLRRHRIGAGHQTITVTVPRQPTLAGIDPHHVLDWEQREDDDNVAAVKIESRAGARRSRP